MALETLRYQKKAAVWSMPLRRVMWFVLDKLLSQKKASKKIKICLTPPPPHPPGSSPGTCAGKMVSGLATLIYFNEFFYEDI